MDNSNQANYSLYELTTIFPEAIDVIATNFLEKEKEKIKQNLLSNKNYLKKKYKKEIESAKRDLKEAQEIKNQTDSIIGRVQPKNQWFIKMIVEELYIKPLTEGRERTIKRNNFLLSSLNAKSVKKNKITDNDIEQAKSVPIETFLEIGHSGFAKCPFHEEKIPSLKVYKKTNSWYCFSCMRGGTVVDLIMKKNNCDFIEAIKILLNK